MVDVTDADDDPHKVIQRGQPTAQLLPFVHLTGNSARKTYQWQNVLGASAVTRTFFHFMLYDLSASSLARKMLGTPQSEERSPSQMAVRQYGIV